MFEPSVKYYVLTPEELRDTIAMVVREELQLFAKGLIQAEKAPEELISRTDVAKQLDISLPTLDSYVRKGIIKGYRFGKHIRFKKSEVLDCLKEMKGYGQ